MIAALLSHRNVEEAARAIGISTNTLQRWMKEPEFQTRFQESRRVAFSQALDRLQDASGAAATTTLKIMVDANVPPGVRLRAAEIVLQHGAKAAELEKLEDRVARLERKEGLKTQSTKHSGKITLLQATPLLGPSPEESAQPPDRTDTDRTQISDAMTKPLQPSSDELGASPSWRISVPEIATRLRIGRLAVYAMLEQGIIPAIRLGRRWIITRRAYNTWEETCGLRPGAGLSAPTGANSVN